MSGSDLDALIAECGPRHWLCGHAHTTHQVTIGTTQISSNPRAGDGRGTLTRISASPMSSSCDGAQARGSRLAGG
jgi:hypothetical protein